MKIYRKQNVFDAALDRIRWLFDEFENVIVNVSGGKDSTVIYNLALMVAEEKGRLPLDVFFIDQEAEWQAVIDYMRVMMSDPRVNPLWLQCPIKIFNGTSQGQDWLYCWEEGGDWIRDKEENSIKENVYGTMRFTKIFEAYNRAENPDVTVARIAGVRTEESNTRAMGLTHDITYKWATWGRKEDVIRGHYTFHPIYDWGYTDVWKAIHDNGWQYTKVYDYMYQYGVPINNMRVSNVHHETAIQSLFYMQEVEPETWNKIVGRVQGINTAGMLGKSLFNKIPKEIPYMFSSWREYRDYLLDNLIGKDENRGKLTKKFRIMQQMIDEGRYFNTTEEKMYKAHIKTILVNDVHLTKLESWDRAHKITQKQWEGEWTQFKFKG